MGVGVGWRSAELPKLNDCLRPLAAAHLGSMAGSFRLRAVVQQIRRLKVSWPKLLTATSCGLDVCSQPKQTFNSVRLDKAPQVGGET